MIQESRAFGIHLESDRHIIFFGNKQSQFESLHDYYPDFSFARLRQTHGTLICCSENEEPSYSKLPEADAHWSTKSRLALCISTADCMPIFISDRRSNLIFGIHAGWRGIAAKILPLSITKACALGASPKDLEIYVGPHIRQASFEVDRPCLNALLATLDSNSDSSLLYKQFGEKYLVDLEKILLLQIKDQGLSEGQVVCIHQDTKTNLNFHSHRRDREMAGRQLSFIVRK